MNWTQTKTKTTEAVLLANTTGVTLGSNSIAGLRNIQPCLHSTDSDKNSNEYSENSGLWNRSSQICFFGLWYVVSCSLCHGVYEFTNGMRSRNCTSCLLFTRPLCLFDTVDLGQYRQSTSKAFCLNVVLALLQRSMHWNNLNYDTSRHIKTIRNNSMCSTRTLKLFSAAFG